MLAGRIRTLAFVVVATVGGSAIFRPADAAGPDGQFSGLISWPIVGMHTTLLPDGTVLTYGTNLLGTQRNDATARWVYDIWTPSAGTGSTSHATLPNTTPSNDIFCSVATLIAGTDDVLLIGGSAIKDGWAVADGVQTVRTFDTTSRSMVENAGSVEFPRWYPTATTMANGDIVMQGGTKPDISTPEVFTPSTGTWRTLTGATSDPIYRTGRSYPRSWVGPDGLIFGLTGEQMFRLDPAGTGTITSLGKIGQHRDYASAAMYAPGKILVIGGLPNGHAVSLIDINGPSPVVTPGPPMAFSRNLYANAVILPDGKVFVVGGGDGYVETSQTALPAEIWDPATNAWTTVDSVEKPRVYHSSALLLPDGRVLVTGGGVPGFWTNMNAELFSPGYLAGGTRPIIDIAPGQAVHGKRFAMWLRSDAPISRLTFLRTGSSTHGYDVDQRLIELDFVQNGRRLDVRAPDSLIDAPPGWYQVFALDANGVPSVGRIISLS